MARQSDVIARTLGVDVERSHRQRAVRSLTGIASIGGSNQADLSASRSQMRKCMLALH